MKHIGSVLRVMIAIWPTLLIFYPNKYIYGILTLLILIQITVELKKTKEKHYVFLYFPCLS